MKIQNSSFSYIGDVNIKNQPHGKGKIVWSSGESYEGDFKNGQLDGFGEMRWTDGTYQRGEFKNSEAHGVSEWIDDGEVYYGRYDNGLLLDYIEKDEYDARLRELRVNDTGAGLSAGAQTDGSLGKNTQKSDTFPDISSKNGDSTAKNSQNASSSAIYSSKGAQGDNSAKNGEYDKGYKAGYREGWEKRDKDLDNDKTFILARIEGRRLGEKDGYKKGYDEGYKKGKEEEKQAHSGEKTYIDGRIEGRKLGEKDGYKQGYDEGYKKGYDEGYEKAKKEFSGGAGTSSSLLDKMKELGESIGYKKGYDEGYKRGKESTGSSSSYSSASSYSNSATSSRKRNGPSGLADKDAHDPCLNYKPDGKVASFKSLYTYKGEYFYDPVGVYGGYNNVPHGRGKYYDDNGNVVIDGFFVNGAQEGYGWKKDEDGSIYEGYFSDGLKHGLGRLVEKDGTVTEGIFIKGKIDHGFIKQTLKNGTIFEGYVAFDMYVWDHGRVTYPNGGVFEGRFGHYPYKGWQDGTYKIGSKTYEGSWSGDFVASRVTLTEYGRKTEVKAGKI